VGHGSGRPRRLEDGDGRLRTAAAARQARPRRPLRRARAPGARAAAHTDETASNGPIGTAIGTGSQKSPISAPDRAPADDRNMPLSRQKTPWRDRDSNPGHHDFQAHQKRPSNLLICRKLQSSRVRWMPADWWGYMRVLGMGADLPPKRQRPARAARPTRLIKPDPKPAVSTAGATGVEPCPDTAHRMPPLAALKTTRTRRRSGAPSGSSLTWFACHSTRRTEGP
jgi:hypothetical protein